MPQNGVPRYSTFYRRDEIELIINSAGQGESLAFMGVAGVGKSNIVNFLRDIEVNAPHVEQDVARLHFPIVDATQWQGTYNSLWVLMLDALNGATASLPTVSPSPELLSVTEDQRIFRLLQTRLDYVCQEREHQVMFVLDDFDRVFEKARLDELERLSVLRSAGNRGYLSYLVITKKLPHVLGRNKSLEQNCKFYDLLRHNIYALEPYTRTDALQMLAHLNQKTGNILSEEQLEHIYRLAGGHAGLLKVVFFIKQKAPATELKAIQLAANPDIKQECQRVFSSLHWQEQQVALRVTQGVHRPEDSATIDQLARRGLLVRSSGAIYWFSPLLANYLKTFEE